MASYKSLTSVGGSTSVFHDQRINPPGEPPLQWLLLCTDGQATLHDAVKTIRWHVRQWTIEERFRTLKTG